jgi:hypothetical protein
MGGRGLTYEYLSTRRLEELEARVVPSWFARVARGVGSLSVSVLGVGVGVGQRDRQASEFARQLRTLDTVTRDLRGHDEVGPIGSGRPYVEHEMLMVYSLWTFEDGDDRTRRTAAFWYGLDLDDSPARQVVLIGNPRYLRGVPDASFQGIPIGSASADPAWNRAYDAVRRHLAHSAIVAAGDQDVAGVPDLDLDDELLERHFSNLLFGIGSRLTNAVEDGRIPDAAYAPRRFLARRVTASRGGENLVGTPVYVATVDETRPARG